MQTKPMIATAFGVLKQQHESWITFTKKALVSSPATTTGTGSTTNANSNLLPNEHNGIHNHNGGEVSPLSMVSASHHGVANNNNNFNNYYYEPNIDETGFSSPSMEFEQGVGMTDEQPYYRHQQDADEENEDDEEADDDASTQQLLLLENYRNGDLDISILSNSIFLLAGTFYLIVGVWDLIPAYGRGPIAAESSSLAVTNGESIPFMYTFFSNIAPFTYLANSCIDIVLANRLRQRQKDIKEQKRLQALLSLQSPLSAVDENNVNTTMGKDGHHHVEILKQSIPNPSSLSTSSSLFMLSRTGSVLTARKRKNWQRRIVKHAAHRRDLYAALSFFVAAFAGSLCVIMGYYDPFSSLFTVSGTVTEAPESASYDMLEETEDLLSTFLDSFSIHMYMVSAIFALLGSRVLSSEWYGGGGLQWENLKQRRRKQRAADALEDAGDIFFLTGSIVDVILCDFHFDDNVLWWPVISASLWVLDAIFYLRSDQITHATIAEQIKQQQKSDEILDHLKNDFRIQIQEEDDNNNDNGSEKSFHYV